MAPTRSRRLRLLESLRRTINEMLHSRVQRLARARGHGTPHNTSTIYASASREAPELLDQLLLVHRRVAEERGEEVHPTMPEECSDLQRKAMLSAVRAAVNQTRESLESRTE
jgi:hypothetical protein